VIIGYLETQHRLSPYEIETQFLFPVFIEDLIQLENPIIINIENNE